MARSKSDISNTALRIFLQQIGIYYDQKRGYQPIKPNKKQYLELLNYFNFRCIYCDSTLSLDGNNCSIDHLIPINKASQGLHAWGNVIPCCKSCNNEKNNKNWQAFLKEKVPIDFQQKKELIENFVSGHKYEPNLQIQEITNNLYQDVGEVALTLIKLRIRQAEDKINNIVSDEKKMPNLNISDKVNNSN